MQPSFPDQVIYMPSTPNLLEGMEYLVTLGTQLDDSGLSTDTPCTVSTPYLSSSCGYHLSVTKSGNLRLELGFKVTLSITGNVLVYSEFDNVIEIDKDRKVARNFGH